MKAAINRKYGFKELKLHSTTTPFSKTPQSRIFACDVTMAHTIRTKNLTSSPPPPPLNLPEPLSISYPESTGFLVSGRSPVETLGYHKSWDSGFSAHALVQNGSQMSYNSKHMRSVHSWSLHTIEDTRNFWTRRMVIYFVCWYVTKRFKRLIRLLSFDYIFRVFMYKETF